MRTAVPGGVSSVKTAVNRAGLHKNVGERYKLTATAVSDTKTDAGPDAEKMRTG